MFILFYGCYPRPVLVLCFTIQLVNFPGTPSIYNFCEYFARGPKQWEAKTVDSDFLSVTVRTAAAVAPSVGGWDLRQLKFSVLGNDTIIVTKSCPQSVQ